MHMHICMYCKFRVPVMLGPAIKKSKQLIEGFDALSRVFDKPVLYIAVLKDHVITVV